MRTLDRCPARGPSTSTPTSASRFGRVAARRRRRPPRRRDLRQRRLRLPRRRPAHHGRDVPRRRRARGRRSAPRWATATWPGSAAGSSTSPPTTSTPTSSTSWPRWTAIARAVGSAVTYVKPHGALYNAVVHHEVQADAVVRAVADYSRGLPVVGLPGSALLAAAAGAGLRDVREAFADRGYTAAGTLVPRSEPGALLDDPEEVAARVLRLVRRGPRDGDRRRRGRARGRLRMRPRRLPRGRRDGPCRPERLVGGRSPAGAPSRHRRTA